MLSKDTKIDWQTCALALNRKLNLLTARLQQTEHTSTLFDVVSFSRSLRDEFHLETDSDFVKPDFVALRRKYDEIGHLIHQLRYASVSKREALLNRLLELDSEFSMELAIHGAFV